MTVSSKAGRYELQQELGRGSMGIVYRALDPVIGRTVAVKTVQLAAEVAGLSHSELLTRFQTEARAAGLLAHPNIVTVYDAGEDDGVFYITMELVEGRSLQEQMNLHQSFPLPRVMRWMQQACAALEFAHQNCVIHRDIKPANLMLTADDTLKVTDFGTAKILQLNPTQTAHVMGTPSYMSPEQIKGKPVDGRSDIFSLGVVLYELVTGAKPFPGDSVTSVIYKVVNEDPIPPREMDSTIHPGLSAVIQRALTKSPWARFQSCQEFAKALENYQTFEAPRAASVAPALPPGSPQTPTNVLTSGPASRATNAPIAPSVNRLTIKQPILEEPFEEKIPARRQSGFVWIALLLVTVIGAGGYRLYPTLREVWQPGHSASPAEVAPANPTASDAAPVNAVETPNSEAQPAVPAAPSAAVPTNRKSGSPQPSEVAAEWKDLIEAKVASNNIAGDVRVQAVGNSVTLTGKLDAAMHRKLLGQLQFVPPGLQIIDDIESSNEPSAQPPQDSAPSAK